MCRSLSHFSRKGSHSLFLTAEKYKHTPRAEYKLPAALPEEMHFREFPCYHFEFRAAVFMNTSDLENRQKALGRRKIKPLWF